MNMKTKQKTTSLVDVPPNASRTLEALREMGYDSFAAICDLIDNSIDAGADKIEISISAVGDGITVDVLDNGRGMDSVVLAEALRLGSRVEAYDPTKRLGKFGMGLVTASLSMAQNIWIVSRAEGKPAYEAVLDMDTIRREDRFVINLKPARPQDVFSKVGNRGTFVRLSKIDRATDTNVSRFAQNLRARVGQVYRHYLKDKLTIMVNSRNARRHDPLMLDHPETVKKLDMLFDLGDSTSARLIVVELPDLGTEGDAAAGIAPHNSGFYIVRNGREILAGETFGFYRHHHSYSHFRAEVSYQGNSRVFHEDVKKSSIHPDDKFKDRLRRHTEKFIMDSGRLRRELGGVPVKLSHKGSSEIIALGSTKKTPTVAAVASITPLVDFEEAELKQPDSITLFECDRSNGRIVVRYNVRHPLIRFVSEAGGNKAHTILDLIAYGLVKTEDGNPSARKAMKDLGEHLAVLAAPAMSDK